MADNQRAREAYSAARKLGIPGEKVKPLLRHLFRIYDRNWEYIEAENYRVLIDTYYELVESKDPCLAEEEGSNKEKDVRILPSKRPYVSNAERRGPSTTDEGDEVSPNGIERKNSMVMENTKNSNVERCSGSANLPITRKKSCGNGRQAKSRNLADISKGTESVEISLVDEIGTEALPTFTYIPQNLVYQNAYVHISLARISDEDCCSSCRGNCLSSPVPCACARETGGEFAYSKLGFLKEEFLDACISMKKEPNKYPNVYCQDCPLERMKNEFMPDKCGGHLVRKFIKECWRKCGCGMQCGNRVVQRGISCELQVFSTQEGKGWGVRTLQDLPKGSFVCEYVGEVLTNTELYERNLRSFSSDRHTYPVTLDADWGSEKVLKDEEALCLDATLCGNVARFINHRCFDATVIDIPVEIETPDRHYYHLAFFTTRKVDAMEEITWDYGIDFSDHNHPIKAFKCCCGSEFCRDVEQKEIAGTRGKASGRKNLISARKKAGERNAR